MATRLYFPTVTAAPVSPAFDASWTDTEDALRRKLEPIPTNSNTNVVNLNVDETSASSINSLGGQYVSSNTMLAGTINGTVSIAFGSYQVSGSPDSFFRVVVKVVSSDGLTVRGVLFSGTHGSENHTSLQTRVFNAQAVTPVVASAGDRLVVEIGQHFANSTSVNQTAGLAVGDPIAGNSGVDLPLSDGIATQSTDRPWVELSQDVFPAITREGGSAAEAMIVPSLPERRLGASAVEAVIVTNPLRQLGAFAVEVLVPIAGQKIPGLYIKGERSRTPLMKGTDGVWRAIRTKNHPID